MREINLLVDIVRNNPNIVVQNSEIKEVVREVFAATGVLIGIKPQLDYYDHPFHTDYDGEPRQMFRPNKRKFSLSIKKYE